MAKRVDPVKAKEKKQKIVAAVGGVILLIVLGIQGPTLWSQLNPKAPAAAAPIRRPTTTGTTPGSTPSLAVPTLHGGAEPTVPNAGADAGSLLAGSATPTRDELTSFSQFASKDPFAQQLSDKSTSSTGGTGAAAGGSSSGSQPPSPSSSGGGSGAPAPGTAVFSVNGTLMAVAVGADFPQAGSYPGAQPFFHLVSLTAHTAAISISGGSYTSGAATVTLKENKPVTLVNTADGTRYRIILEPEGTAVPAPASTTTTGGTTTTSGP